MPTLTTPLIAVKTTPTVIGTFFTHFLARKKRHSSERKEQKKEAARLKAANDGSDGMVENGQTGEEAWENPEREFSYDEGLQIVKRFLAVAANHTVEELQAFTAAHVPVPTWIHLSHVPIPSSSIDKATSILLRHFETVYGPDGVKEIGGSEWWKMRGKDLEGEWIEMKKSYLARTVAKVDAATGEAVDDPDQKKGRVILYIHGGAFFFSSIDTHRYQIQRHARKLGGRAFTPSYRLAPQYPFPCGLHDALSTYLFLIDPPAGSSQAAIPPSSIILSGDSAGAGLILSLLVVIRDSGGTIPMPAGACLISPWVDLTHSFKSVSGDDRSDYIPSSGFHYKPSPAWPPLKGDGIEVDVKDSETGHSERRLIDDQIQMYASNRLLSHPLVSPVNQGSLGGLCPIMVMGGSGELLRDEMIFLAHKAASPTSYPPAQHVLDRYPHQKEMINRFPPTKVHLQMYDGCAHVTPTLSFTKPAKWMYRACANFNIWAIEAAQLAEKRASTGHHHSHHHHHRPKKQGSTSTSGTAPSRSSTINSSYTSSPTTTTPDSGIPLSDQATVPLPIDEHIHQLANDADNVSDAGSECSSDSDFDEDSTFPANELVTVTGVEPAFVDSMIRERVSVRGRIRPFEPVGQCDTFAELDLQGVGRVHGDGPIVKWLAARGAADKKFSKALEKNRELKAADLVEASKSGYLTRDLTGPLDRPPLCSLALWHSQSHAREIGKSVDEVGRRGKSVGGATALWMKLASKQEELRNEHDAEEIEAMAKSLSDKGISEKAVDVIGDKKVDGVKGVKHHLEKEGVDVVEPAPAPSALASKDAGAGVHVAGHAVEAGKEETIVEEPRDVVSGSESPEQLKLGRVA